MGKKCPECGFSDNPDDAVFCEECGANIGKKPSLTSRSTYGNLNPQTWLILFIIMEVIGTIAVFIGFWIVGLPIIIAAGFLAYQMGNELIPRITLLISMIAIVRINLIPENETISLFGFAIAWMAIIMIQPEEERRKEEEAKTNLFAGGRVLYIGIAGLIATVLWTMYILMGVLGGVTPILVAIISATTGGMVGASVVWKQPLNPLPKLILTMVCFAPVLFFTIQFAFIYGSATFGGLLSDVQRALSSEEGLGISGTALDMILNPELAVQAGLKPATTREVSETSGPPSVAFSVSGETIPSTGCYDSSTFQVIGRVENTGGEYIQSLDLFIKPEPTPPLSEGIQSPCNNINFQEDQKKFPINSLPTGVTKSKNRIILNITAPESWFGPGGKIRDAVRSLFGEEEEEDIIPSYSCYIDIIAKTGYHGLVRLPIQFIESDYARNKFEQKQLTQTMVPGTVSTGPVEFSIGGFEQPVLYYGDQDNQVTMITSISNTGNGLVSDYTSAYLYIPNTLLKDGECANYGSGDDWECIDSMDCDELSNEEAANHCEAFEIFKDYENIGGTLNENEIIGGYQQFSYDGSDNLLNEGYSICFFTDEISTQRTITTGTCTLNVGEGVMTEEDLRRTLIIRGDVLYTYRVSGDTRVGVRDCNV